MYDLIATNALIDGILYFVPYGTRCICAVDLNTWNVIKLKKIDDYNNFRWAVFYHDGKLICCGLDNVYIYYFDLNLQYIGNVASRGMQASDAFFYENQIYFVPQYYSDNMYVFSFISCEFNVVETWGEGIKRRGSNGKIKKRLFLDDTIYILADNREMIICFELNTGKMSTYFHSSGRKIIDYCFWNNQLFIVYDDDPNSLYDFSNIKREEFDKDFKIRKVLVADRLLIVDSNIRQSILDEDNRIVWDKQETSGPSFNNTYIFYGHKLILPPWQSNFFIEYDISTSECRLIAIDDSLMAISKEEITMEQKNKFTLEKFLDYIEAISGN